MADNNFFSQFHGESDTQPDTNFFTQFHANDGLDDNHRQAREWLDAHPQAQHGFGNNLLEKAVQGVTLGYGDEMRAAGASVRDAVKNGGMPWDYYAREKAMQDEQQKLADKSTGGYGTAADIVGSILPTSLAMRGVGAVSRLPGVVNNMIAGGAIGGADAYGNDRNVAQGIALGAGGGLLGEVVAKGAGKVAGIFDIKPSIPSTAELFDKGSEAFKRFDDSTGLVTADGIKDLSSRLTNTMRDPKFAFDPAAHPNVAAAYRAINKYLAPSAVPDSMAGLPGALGPEAVQAIRQHAANAVETAANRSQARVGMKLKRAVDDWVGSVAEAPDSRISGNIDFAALNEGNKLWSRASKAEKLDNFVDKANRSAATTGRSTDSAMRRAADKMLNKPRGMTANERELARSVVDGTRMRNVGRFVGDNFGYHSIPAAVNHAVGAYHTGGLSLLGGLGAEAAGYASRRGTRNALDELSQLIRAGGNREALAPTPSAASLLIEKARQPAIGASIDTLLGFNR